MEHNLGMRGILAVRRPPSAARMTSLSNKRGEEVDVYRKLGLIRGLEEEEEEEEEDNVGRGYKYEEEGGNGEGAASPGSMSSVAGVEATARPRIVTVLASYLERMVAKNDVFVVQELQGGRGYRNNNCSNMMIRGYEQLTVFHGMKAPGIGVARYVERIYKYAHCSPSCFVVAYAYLDRFIHRHPGVPVTSLNIHRLLITSVMVAAKFLDDAYYNNAYYAKVGGVTTIEMNRLELEFLFTLGFRLQVTTHIFQSYCCHLEREYALGAGPTLYIPPLEKSKLQFSWSFGTPPNFNVDDDVCPDRASTSRDRPVARVRCSSPYISLHLAESVSS
ncbi:hypothetical protein GOP47_0024662 [Adiantum capillus-veneris]|uniref:Cyclin n=1 Tax=Adiantum capillus-veneris TaxID=13818 RepID=A0A9D4U2P2_ADICA|nr:hypothetical protein GOP47_0024662 [Adiantum capillus-veneris]